MVVLHKFSRIEFCWHCISRSKIDHVKRAMGRWIAERINMMQGPVRFLLPEGGVSSIDAPGKVFYDREADNALIEAIEKTFLTSKSRKLQRVAANINDPEFIEAAYGAFNSITPKIIRRI